MRYIQGLLTGIALLGMAPKECEGQEIKLRNFNVFSDGKYVHVNWTIETGSICDGVTIYRSTDSTNLQPIGFIDGICGSSSKPVGYSFTDSTPIQNRIAYYALKLGYAQYTETRKVFFISDATEYVVYPNPANSIATILYNTNASEEYSISLTDISGNVVLQRSGLSGQYIFIDGNNLSSGLYIFNINTRSGKRTTGKLLFMH